MPPQQTTTPQGDQHEEQQKPAENQNGDANAQPNANNISNGAAKPAVSQTKITPAMPMPPHMMMGYNGAGVGFGNPQQGGVGFGNPQVGQPDLATQLAMMQRMMQQQAEQMRQQQVALRRKEAEHARLQQQLATEQTKSRLGSEVSEGAPSEASSDVDVLRRQLEAKEQEIKAKDDLLKERDERLSLLTQRSETNSVMSEAEPTPMYMNGFGMKMQNGELPQVRQSLCQCTEQGYRKCILYKRDICQCSFSCQFVKEYFKPPKGNSFFLT